MTRPMAPPPRPFSPASKPPPKPVPWRRRSAPLADFVGALLDPLMAKQGFGQSDLLLHWEEIAGARLSQIAEPIRLQWPPRGPKRAPEAAAEPATLVLRVAQGFGLDVQHLAPILIDRVNAHLGWRCIGKVKIEQGRLQRPLKRKGAAVAPPAPAALARAEQAAVGVEEDGLRQALARLGARIYERAAQGPTDT